MGLGDHPSAQEDLQRLYKRQMTPWWQHRGPGILLESMETVANERERMETDGNGCKQTQNQAGSEAKIYLKAKTYD